MTTKVVTIFAKQLTETVTPDYDPESIKLQITESNCHDSGMNNNSLVKQTTKTVTV